VGYPAATAWNNNQLQHGRGGGEDGPAQKKRKSDLHIFVSGLGQEGNAKEMRGGGTRDGLVLVGHYYVWHV